jgi:hypothetical protein
MKKGNFHLIYFFLLLLTTVSCSKERAGYTVVEGYVTDAITGKAMADLELQVCGKIRYLPAERAYCRLVKTTITGNDGHFRLEFNVTDNDRNYFLEVFGGEHYSGTTSIPLQTGIRNEVNLRLKPLNATEQFK